MTLDLAVPAATASGIALDHEGILRSLNLNPRDPKTQAMLLVCERYGIDPLMKHAVLISGNIYVTRDGYLHVAHRSGQFDGIEVLETGETPTHYTAKVAVYRKDMRHPFTYTGRFPKSERMAKTFGPEMAVKVAEVQALRRAFNVTGVAASDERWDVDPSEVVHAVAEDETPALPPADPETGEVVEPTPLIRRRPPPNVAKADPAPARVEGGPVCTTCSAPLGTEPIRKSGGVFVHVKCPTSPGGPAPAGEAGAGEATGEVAPAPAPSRRSAPGEGEGVAPSSLSGVAPSPPPRSARTTALMAAATQRFPDRAERLQWAEGVLGRPVTTFGGLSVEDETKLLDRLNRAGAKA